MTIRSKLAVWYSGLLITIILVLSLAVITVSRASMLSAVDNALDETAGTVIRNIRVLPALNDINYRTRLAFQSEAIFAAPDISVQVWQTHDSGMVIDPLLARQSNYLDGELDTALHDDALHTTTIDFASTIINDIPGRVATRPFNAGGQPVGVIQVASPIQTITNANDTLTVIVFIAATISIIISIMLSMWISARMTRPIQQLTQAAGKIVESEDLSTRLLWDGSVDEMGNMIQVFNRMMERLEHLFNIQQRFVGDVSHEMRTPLTSILGHVEIMQRYGADDESLDAIHREAERLARMVSDLLMLARADNGELQIDLGIVDVDTVILQVYEQTLMLVQQRDLKITLKDIQPCRIEGNSDRLKQLLLNLISNAIKFTPDGGKISLSLMKENEQAVICIEDSGIGISEDDVLHIFDAFFQADSSRRRQAESDGAGLGLSIVQRLVKAHKGTITVESKPDKGTIFEVRFSLHDDVVKQ